MDIAIVLELAAFVVFLCLSAFFSSSETALFSLNRIQLEQLRRSADPHADLIERLLSQPRHLIVTILIGNEFVNVAASVISAALVIEVFGSGNKWINLLIMVPVLLLFGEITPKTLAIRHNLAFATAQCRGIDLFARLISPLRWVVRHVADFFITLIVGKERSRANILTEDMVRSLAEEAVGKGALDRHEAVYINRIFDFGDKVVSDVMTPRSQVKYLRADATIEEAARHYRRTNHTKVPVYGDSPGNVVGVLYSRDLLGEGPEADAAARAARRVADIMRPAYFVPETKSVADLFYTFRKRQLSLALTVDEFGGVTGLVTMEDLLECIFGEIMSPSELVRQKSLSVEEAAEGSYRIDGAMTIRQFNRVFGVALKSSAVDTIGGVLLDAFGELPAEGMRIVVEDCEFTVESVAGQRIARVLVTPPAPLTSPQGSGAPVEGAVESGSVGAVAAPCGTE